MRLFEVAALTGLYRIKFTIPLTEKIEKVAEAQPSLFDIDEQKEKWRIIPGKRARIMNWDTNKMEFFDKEVRRIWATTR